MHQGPRLGLCAAGQIGFIDPNMTGAQTANSAGINGDLGKRSQLPFYHRFTVMNTEEAKNI